MDNNINPMGHLPQLVEAMLARLEAMLVAHMGVSPRRGLTEVLLNRLRRQACVMRTVAESSDGEGLTPEMKATLSNVPTTIPQLFPLWASNRKKSK